MVSAMSEFKFREAAIWGQTSLPSRALAPQKEPRIDQGGKIPTRDLRPNVRPQQFSPHKFQQHVSGIIPLERNFIMLIHIFEVLVAATALLLTLILLLWRIESSVEFLEQRIPVVFRSAERTHWGLRVICTTSRRRPPGTRNLN